MTGYNKNYVAETVTDGLEESTDLVALLQKQEDQIAGMTSQLEGVRESLSQSTEWVTAYSKDGNTVKCRRRGNLVTVAASMTAYELAQSWTDVTVLPSEMRPDFDLYFPGIPQSGTTPIKCEIAADGHLWAAPHGGTATGFLFVASYLV